MTRFEEVGINLMMSCNSVGEVTASYNRSCDLCCLRGRRCECDHCIIAVAHEKLVNMLTKKEVMA